MRRRWKIILAVAASLIAVSFGLLVLAGLTAPLWQRSWIEPIEGVRLEPARPILREADVQPDSAFDLLRRVAAATPQIENMEVEERQKLFLRQWSDQEFPAFSKALAQSEEALELARRAARAPNPQVVTMLNVTDRVDYLGAVLNLSRIVHASAAANFAAGNYDAALEELLNAIRLAELFSRGGVLIHRLVTISMELATLEKLRLAVLQRDLPEDLLVRISNELHSIQQNQEPWPETFRQEWLAVRNSISNFFKQLPEEQIGAVDETTVFFHRVAAKIGGDPELTEKTMAALYTHLVRLAEEPSAFPPMEALVERVQDQGRGWRLWLYEDPVGLLAAKLSLPVFKGLNERYILQQTALAATRAVVAIRAFQIGQGRPPQNLRELTPQYFKEVPQDPFDSKPLRYVVRSDGSWIVYSVGPNQVDEGGVEFDKPPKRREDRGDLIFPSNEPEQERERLQNT